MVTRTLSAALIALLLTTPLAAAWCEACIQDRCDMSMDALGTVPDAHSSAADDAMARHHGSEEVPSHAAESSHCAEMAKASTGASEVETPSPSSTSTAPVPTCCVDATSDDVQIALAPKATQLVQVDLLPVASAPMLATVSTHRSPANVDWTPRPPPRPLFTLHSLLLI